MLYDPGGKSAIDPNKIFPCTYTPWQRWFAWYPVTIKAYHDLPYFYKPKKAWLQFVWRRRNLTFKEWDYTIDDVFWQLTNGH